MSKLSLDALKMRAEATASEDLLATISGGTENSCHNNPLTPEYQIEKAKAESELYKPIGDAIKDWWNGLWD